MGEGIPIVFHFTVGKTTDTKLYGDSAYTDYQIEDYYLLENKYIELKIQRKRIIKDLIQENKTDRN
ncbi:MAG: hypothetical protein Q3983_05180 [Capnocytophaga sp.]|nr:hypothetical protein [Capnocytophaga sp.]